MRQAFVLSQQLSRPAFTGYVWMGLQSRRSAVLKVKMSSTEAEKTTIGTSDLSHKYSGPEDTIEKGDPPKLLKENSPNFLSARTKMGTVYLSTDFEKKDKNKDEKTDFS
ncbi:hypothetical protein E2I00_015542 [Balaenoptera physalus]|uniref:Uncharacterized protein n=1 Tax=Balaenoptera physalus TaxID=9770 RepID=A0A643C7V3_BALPH|nr:hypothetical protein E2I00_015542 [Balaenoptera physalus]